MNLPSYLARIVPGGIDRTPVISLFIANLVTLLLAVTGNLDVLMVIFIFWAQSLIIGFFTFFRLLGADTALLAEELGKAEEWTGRGPVASRGRVWQFKILVAGFFLFHYGLFHLFYYILFFQDSSLSHADMTAAAVLVPLAFFFFHHLFSLVYFWKAGPKGGQFMADAIILPYNRIVPMHLTMLFGYAIASLLAAAGFETLLPVLVVFIALKTWMDIRMHIVLHEREAHPEKRDLLFVWF